MLAQRGELSADVPRRALSHADITPAMREAGATVWSALDLPYIATTADALVADIYLAMDQARSREHRSAQLRVRAMRKNDREKP